MQQEYSFLAGFKENLPGTELHHDVSESYITEYHRILERISNKGFDVSLYFVSPEHIKPRRTSCSPSRGTRYTSEKFCERGHLVGKVDALLLLFKLKSSGDEVELIGFRGE